MERLRLARVANFDDDVAVHNCGRDHDKAFEVLR
jgi:hypothetical protein